MPALDTASLISPVSAEAPCGPDLDQSGDFDFLSFVNVAEGTLPESYARFAANRDGYDFKPLMAAAPGLLERSRDLRVIVLVAKLSILDRDLPSFVSLVEAVAALLDTQWDHVHPQPAGDDAAYRLSILQALDDMPHTVLALQSVPLFETRRIRLFSYRLYQVAKGQLPARPDEEVVSSDLVDSIVKGLEPPPLKDAHALVARLAAAVDRIGAICRERTGDHAALSLDRLSGMCAEILAFLARLIGIVDPAAAPAADEGSSDATEPGGGASSVQSPCDAGPVTSAAHAAAALRAVVAYFSTHEPASPALLIASQARNLVGKSFIETVRALVPGFAGNTTIRLGKGEAFSLNADALADLSANLPQAPEPAGAPAASFTVNSRQDATQLMGHIAAYFRSADPSSAIPLLMDRARGMTGRDFVAILQEALPPAAFRDDE